MSSRPEEPPGSTVDAAKSRRQRLTGIGLMCLAVVCFTGIDTSAKFLNQQMDTVQVVWARYAVAFLLTFFIANPITRPSILVTRRPMLQIVRSLLLIAATALNFTALLYLRLDQTVTISFSTPFMVAVLAGPILGEWVGIRRWMAILVGFCGVLLITRPGFGGIHPAAILAFIGMASYAVYIIITRMLSTTDSTATTLFYSNLLGAAALTLIVPFFWTPPEDALAVFLMVFMGACGMTGHYLLILAYRLAPASVVAPFIYTQIVSGIIAGYLFFDDLPDRWTLIGAAVVIASGIYLLYREQRVAPRNQAA